MSKLAPALRSLAALTVWLLFTLNAAGQALNVLHNFGVSAGDGDIPYSSLTNDNAGNLYGTTLTGGAHGLGTVYRLSPNGNGWKETVIYSFKGGSADGASPHAPLFRDSRGNFYSTTIQGGLKSKNCVSSAPSTGCGVVFKLTPKANGQWSETVLHFFTGGPEGGNPYAGLIQDSAGNFYGAASTGGAGRAGTAYKLSLNGTTWTATGLHSFGNGADGKTPYGGLVFDGAGDLYGTTYAGGSAGVGVVYELVPQAGGSWKEKILHTFQGKSGNDGAQTFSGVVLDGKGNVFGSTIGGGNFNYGTVFELDAANGYASTVLHSFDLNNVDGTLPNGVIFDASGNLWGTTEGAGLNDGNGTIFEMTLSSSGWTETVVFTFTGSADGTYPNTGLTMDATGRLFGATIWGGTAGDTNGGVAFEFVP